MDNPALLDVKHLSVIFRIQGNTVPVVDRVSFSIRTGEVLAVVGESGCGKSQLALALAGLSPKQAIVEASIEKSRPNLKISMIFQEPLSALNPVLTIGEQIREALVDRSNSGNDRQRVLELLKAVGIDNPESRYDNYPHEFSGGMRQRVLIAIALAMEPDLLIADEPTTALDVTIQRQILELLQDINRTRNLSILFITHDLSLLPSLADRIIVMYAGKFVEVGKTASVMTTPRHPYTQKLLSTAQLKKTADGQFHSIPGSVPSADRFPAGCRFSPRCDLAENSCFNMEPEWREVGEQTWACPIVN